jgi:hypothetical protein
MKCLRHRLEILKILKNGLEILNIGAYDPFLWCWVWRKIMISLESRLKKQRLTTTGSKPG